MPVQNLNFQGINRAISDYANAGACEELINLRPTTGGLVPVKPFKDKYNTNISCQKVFTHKSGSANNHLTISITPGQVQFSLIFTIAILNDDGTQTTVEAVPLSSRFASSFSINDVYFATAGNIILFSLADKTNKGLSENLEYIWDGTQYNRRTADTPSIEVDPLQNGDTPTGSFALPSEPTLDQLVDTINVSLNALQENNPTLYFGPFILALAYKTKDGNTFWTWNWQIWDPTPGAKTGSAYIDKDSGESDFPNFFQVFDEGFLIAGNTSDSFTLSGDSLSLRLYLDSAFDYEKDIIESIEIYASKPIPYIDTDAMLKSGLTVLDFSGVSGGAFHYIAPVTQYKDMALDKQLLYLQKTVLMKELEGHDSEDPLTIPLSFGGNVQRTGKTLVVDAGAVTRFGSLLSYNARFHYYDSYSRTEISMPEFAGLWGRSYDMVNHHVFVVYNNGKKDNLLYLGTKKLFNDDYPLVIASHLNIREVHTYYREDPTDDWTVKIYLMDKSQTYNYTISTGGPADNDAASDTEHTTLIGYGRATKSVTTDEPDAINVTEQYNPFVFRVEHSYLAPGKVLDMQPQMVAVADVSYGDYPLNVFTNRGLYALLQGSGTVLYGAFRPVSNLVTTANSVPTESGTFFLASGNLWAIAGSKAILISDALSLGPHKYIRNCAGYQAISNGEYNVQDYESKVTFEDYVNGGIHNDIDCGNGATLSYNRYRDELFISNTAFDYSYVLSLKYRQWFKMDLKVVQDVVGDAILMKPVGTDLWRVLDLSDESEDTSVLVHLQTRPFSMGYQYIHVHRLISMVRAALSTDDLLIVGLYGSDDLQNWKLLSYASRSGVEISQIRTPSAARSWRYYTLCIGGTCPSDTDFGTTLFEYRPVIRRLG